MNPRLVALVAVGLLGGLVLAEIGARAWFTEGIPLQITWGTPDDDVEKRAHNSVQTVYGPFSYDRNGFRGSSRSPNYDRFVLFIGDSFTEGFGVGDEDTFARAAERSLRRDGFMVRSLNAGHRGFGTAQELKILRRVLKRMHVDGIVVQSFPMNDFSDNLAYGGFGIENDQLVEYETPKPVWPARLASAIGRSWLQNLYVVRLAANAMFAGNGPAPYDSADSFDLETALLGEIVSTAREQDVPIVVLVVPTKLVQQRQGNNAPTSTVEAGELRRFEHVRALMQAQGVPYVDAGEIIPDLEGDAAKADGAHFSREGNARIGEAIAQKLGPLLRASPATGQATGPGS
jgi:lysophospholipase L1-like esterase